MPGTTPAVGDLLQIRTVCYTTQQIAMNVLHYEVVATAGVPLTLAQVALLFNTRMAALYKSMMPTTARWRGCDVQNLMPPATLRYAATASDGVGAQGDRLTPTQTSLLIRTQGNFAGRAFIGHVYPGLITDFYIDADGALTAGGLAALDNLKAGLGPAFAMVGDTGQISLNLVIRHPNTLGPIIMPVWTRVQEMISLAFVATQRRRGEFGAHNVPPF